MSRWRNEALTRTYLEGVRGAIPAAELQIRTLMKIVTEWCPAPREVLDLGCGDGILGRTVAHAFPGTRITFVDFSDPMLDALRSKLGPRNPAGIVKADLSSPDWLERIPGKGTVDLVVSGFSIHHQTHERKRTLYAEIYELLGPGGVFLNLEHVQSATDPVRRLFDSNFIDALFDYHHERDPNVTPEYIANAYYNRPDKDENILAPVFDQCAWLREIGYIDVDCFFKHFELALFGGRKPGANGA
jgi:ubiquinone/menaquinone biosynthesis C-methylase UbiE